MAASAVREIDTKFEVAALEKFADYNFDRFHSCDAYCSSAEYRQKGDNVEALQQFAAE